MVLSIVIPAYNERKTIPMLLDAIRAVPMEGVMKELVVVDDCSTDGTRELLTASREADVRVLLHERNRGKGAAVRTGLAAATGEYVIIQDADLEYDPRDYPRILAPLIAGQADVVYGSRFLPDRPRPVVRYWHSVGNGIITLLSNACSNLRFTDIATCYKIFTRDAVQRILPQLTSERFNIETEITALVAKERLRAYEVGIAYVGRTHAEGKKIRFRDGFAFAWATVRFNLITHRRHRM